MHPARLAVIVTLALGAQFMASGMNATQRPGPAQAGGAVHERDGWLTRHGGETFAQAERHEDGADGLGACIQRPGRWAQPDSPRLPGPAVAMADSLIY